MLYNLLRDGIRVEELYRKKAKSIFDISRGRDKYRRNTTRFDSIIRHFIMVVEDYLVERSYFNDTRTEYLQEKEGFEKIIA